jgi:peroxiredoxin
MTVVLLRRLAPLVLVVLASSGSPAQAPIDVNRLGPQVGDRVPDFRLTDQHGKVWTRDAIMGPKGAMLVFSRSLDWCPFCKTQAAELQTRVNTLKAQGLGLAFITYDPTAIAADFAKRRGITYPILFDAGSKTIRTYGILNTTVPATDARSYGIPFPGTFLVDPSGRVTARFFEETHRERNTVSTILLGLGAAGATTQASRLETEHLTANAYLSDEVVAPGTLFSLVFDITPAPGIHVYAPGAAYRVVRFVAAPEPLLEAKPVEYPASEIYHFTPLDERVPVYQKPFRLTQRLMVSPAPEHRDAVTKLSTLVIRGTLEYQACSDTVCFTPRSIPVSRTVKVRALDTETPTVSR